MERIRTNSAADVANLLRQDVTVKVYDRNNQPNFSSLEIDKISKIGERAYFSPPWGRTTYETCNSCDTIYMGDSLEAAQKEGVCKTCDSALETTERNIADFFKTELNYVIEKIKSGDAILVVAEKDGEVVGIRITLSYGVVRDEARPEATFFVSNLIDNLGIDPSKISYTIDMFVDPDVTKQGLATKMMEAHIRAAKEAGFIAMLGWTEDDNTNMIRRYKAFGFEQLGSEFNMGVDCNPHFKEKKFRVATANIDNARYFVKLL